MEETLYFIFLNSLRQMQKDRHPGVWPNEDATALSIATLNMTTLSILNKMQQKALRCYNLTLLKAALNSYTK
jgi:hypothetical protein